MRIYVNRVRMEGAVFMLAHRADKNMTDIAYALGFTDSAVFSRTFKNFYGVSPSKYRKEYRKNCKEVFLLSSYNKDTAEKKRKTDLFPVAGQIMIEHMEEKQAVYVRHTGTYETLAEEYAGLIRTLFVMAQKQHFYVDEKYRPFAIYHDNPEFGEKSQFRTSLCLPVPKNASVKEDGILGKMKLESGPYAVGYFRIRQEQYADAWNYMYREWLTGSGYVPGNSAPFEVYCNNPHTDVNHIHEVKICVPIEPIRF